MTDIYQAPTAELTDTTKLSGFGSLERGISGQFELVASEIIKESWEKTKGAKSIIWLAMIFYLAIVIPANFGIEYLFEVMGFGIPAEPMNGPPSPKIFIGLALSQAVFTFISIPLGVGLMMIGVRVASGIDTTASEIFNYYPKIISLFLCTLLIYLLIMIGMMLFIIPGLYLMVAYYLALPLMVEKNLGLWAAMEASRKAITKCWFRYSWIMFLYMLIFLVAVIPAGIGLIWVLPMMVIGYGIVYRNIFGFDEVVSQ